MGKRATADEADKISFKRVAWELVKTVLGGVVRAVVSHWLDKP
jgi:hypothetical protein